MQPHVSALADEEPIAISLEYRTAMDVRLSSDEEVLVRQQLKTGRYASASEVVREALRLLDEQDRFLDLKRQGLRESITEGLQSLRSGEGVDGEVVFDRLEAELDAREPHGGG
jgi:antitoxin ParD1/3/4